MMASSASEHVENFLVERHWSQVLATFQQEGLFCDINLISDTRQYPIHRVALAIASSPKTAKHTQIDLGGNVPEAAVNDLISFIYSGSVQITEQNVSYLADWASNYSMESLLQACNKFMLSNVTASNCLDYLHTAKSNKNAPLVHAALAFIKWNLPSIDPEKIHLLDAESFIEVLSESQLNVLEDVVLELIGQWRAAHDASTETVGSLFKLVDFKLLSENALNRVIKSDELRSKFPWMLEQALQNYKEAPKERSYCRSKDHSYVAVLGADKQFRAFDLRVKNWLTGPVLQANEERIITDSAAFQDNATCVVHENRLYVTGGSTGSGKALRVLDFRSKEWTSGPDMRVARWGHGSCISNGKLFVVGGFDPNRKALVACEQMKLEPASGGPSWVPTPPLSKAKDLCSLVPLAFGKEQCTKLMVFGSRHQGDEANCLVEATQDGKPWVKLTSMLEP